MAVSLRRWALENGFTIHDGIGVKCPVDSDGNAGERGVYTTTDTSIDAGETLIRIPWRRVFTTESANSDVHIGALLRRTPCEELPPEERLALYICYIRHNKPRYDGSDGDDGGVQPQCQWYSYVASLPAAYCISLNFTDEHMNALQNKRKRAIYAEEQAIVRSRFDTFVRFVEQHRAVFTPAAAYNYERFLWAYLTVMTRSVYLDPSIAPLQHRDGGGGACQHNIYALIPYADMLNHSNSGVTHVFDPDTRDFVVSAPHAYTGVDREVTLTYGYYGNELLLRYYGFILTENELDSFIFFLWKPLECNDDSLFPDSGGGGGGGHVQLASPATVEGHIAWLERVYGFDRQYVCRSKADFDRLRRGSDGSGGATWCTRRSCAAESRMKQLIAHNTIFSGCADGTVNDVMVQAALLKNCGSDERSVANVSMNMYEIGGGDVRACDELYNAYMWIVHLAVVHLLQHVTTVDEDVRLLHAGGSGAGALPYTMRCIVANRAADKRILADVIVHYMSLCCDMFP